MTKWTDFHANSQAREPDYSMKTRETGDRAVAFRKEVYQGDCSRKVHLIRIRAALGRMAVAHEVVGEDVDDSPSD